MSDSESSSTESMASAAPNSRPKPKTKDPQTPQQKIDEFWSKYKTRAPGKATSIIPQNEVAERAAKRASAKSKAPAKTTQQSYEEAAEQCRRKVDQIVKECRRVNAKYRDPHFDLEFDLKFGRRDCLDSLDNERKGNNRRRYAGGRRGRDSPLKDRLVNSDKAPPPTSGTIMGLLSMVDKEKTVTADGDTKRIFRPQAVKRVIDIFDNPQFFVNGPTANDVRQGRDGDCWLMAALCTLSNKSGLIERCCIAHDVDVGVYGFVFHRDGEWFSEIIDDKLYLTKPDYDESLVERILWEDRERVNSEEAYRKIYQSNSGALFFAQCEDANETWLPLLEKAYAKAHGDYSAIEGGYGGEGIEDLTGGVTSEIYTTDILDKEYFWNEELMKVNEDFLFGCSTGVWGRGWGERKGIVELHAYSVLKAREIDGVRLVLLKNPWGKHEWKGAWSDGSKEWTAEWLQKLDHKFGDDGSFWISYEDLLKKYQAFDRTRLFGPEWKVASIWTTLNVSWMLDYHDTKFAFSLAKSGPVVIVFAQLDERYFRGLEGQYRFELSFRVHRAGEEDYVVRSQNYYRMNRSVNVELELEAGEYVVVVKIDAQRNERIMPVEEVVRTHVKERREKLLKIGLAYDVAHSKGKIIETDEEKAARELYEKRKKESERRKLGRTLLAAKIASRKREFKKRKKEQKKVKQERAKAKAKAERREERRKARLQAKIKEQKEIARPCSANKPANEEVKGKVDPVAMTSQTRESPVVCKDNNRDENSGAKQEVSGTSKATDTIDQRPVTVEKHVTLEVPSATGDKDGGSTSSTDAGVGTPASSTMPEKSPEEDDDNFVTAAEEDNADAPTAAQPPIDTTASRPVPKVAGFSPNQRTADRAVQTEPIFRERPPPPPPMRHRPQNAYHPSSSCPPPQPRPRYLYSNRPPPHDLSRVPPHLRGNYINAQNNRVPSETDLSSTDSDTSGVTDVLSDVSDISDTDIDAVIQNAEVSAAARAAAAAASAGKNGSSAPETPNQEDLLLEEFARDPWNAVGVFGLRVYYKAATPENKKGEGEEEEEGMQEVVKLRIERPNPHVWEESEDDEEAGSQADDEMEDGAEETKVLDVDDSAKDAVGEKVDLSGTVSEKKECVRGDVVVKEDAKETEMKEVAKEQKQDDETREQQVTGESGNTESDDKVVDGNATTEGDVKEEPKSSSTKVVDARTADEQKPEEATAGERPNRATET